MKKILAATAMIGSLASAQVQAGGLAEPIMEEEVAQEAAQGSRAGFLVPVLALLLFALAISNNDDPEIPGCPPEC